jgi:hypothetical protein
MALRNRGGLFDPSELVVKRQLVALVDRFMLAVRTFQLVSTRREIGLLRQIDTWESVRNLGMYKLLAAVRAMQNPVWHFLLPGKNALNRAGKMLNTA